MNGFVEKWIKPSKNQFPKMNPGKHLKWCFLSKLFKGWKLLIILRKIFILDVWQHSEYSSLAYPKDIW